MVCILTSAVIECWQTVITASVPVLFLTLMPHHATLLGSKKAFAVFKMLLSVCF